MIFKPFNILITTIFFLISIQLSFSTELLIPIKKPLISDEFNKKKISSNLILPKIKPSKDKNH